MKKGFSLCFGLKVSELDFSEWRVL